MSVERFLSVRIIKWRTSYFKTRESVIASIAMLIVLIIMNFSFAAFIDYDTAETNVTCFTSDGFTNVMQVSISSN